MYICIYIPFVTAVIETPCTYMHITLHIYDSVVSYSCGRHMCLLFGIKSLLKRSKRLSVFMQYTCILSSQMTLT